MLHVRICVMVIGDQTQHNITLLYRHLLKVSCEVFPDKTWAASPFHVGNNVLNHYNEINNEIKYSFPAGISSINWVPFRATPGTASAGFPWTANINIRAGISQ